MVRRSARLAVKSGVHLPNKGTLGSFSTGSLAGKSSFSTGSLAGKTPAPQLKRKSLEASQRTVVLESSPSDKDYTPSSAGTLTRSPFIRVFPLRKGFVGKIIPVALILLLSLGAWSLFPELPFQGLFAAAFTAASKPTKNMTVVAL